MPKKTENFNIEKFILESQTHQFEEMNKIANETIKENKILNNTIEIQKLKINELENINDKLSRALNDAEQRIDKAIDLIKNDPMALIIVTHNKKEINIDTTKKILKILKGEE